MKRPASFHARILQEKKWFIAFSPEYPEGNGQGLTQAEAVDSLRQSIILIMADRREDALANLRTGETLIPLAIV